jgi:fatty-acyl-CoA synthase
MYHVAGLFIVLAPAILCAATMVLFPHWDGDDALNLIERERISLIGGISTHYLDMVDAMKRRQRDTSSIKVAYIGGATLPGDSFTNIMRTLGLKRLLSTYGMTENTVSTTFNSWDDPVDICRQNKAPVITSGKVKIMDLSTFEAVPTGTEGEIWCSGPTVMLGYYKNPGQTRQVLTEDGWLRTGDLGRFDSNGYLEVTGRLKDIIKVGGTNVSPTEVEGLIMANPAIQFAVVVGVPDVRLGEVPYAYAKITGDRSLSEKEIIEFCRSKMAQFKIPHYVKIVTDFPRLSTGKIDRVQLSKMAVADLSAQEPA